MEKFALKIPTIEDKVKAIEFIGEFLLANSGINGTGSLDSYLEKKSYEEWLKKLEVDRSTKANEERVPSVTYFFVRLSDDKIVGMVNIRLALNKRLREESGHLGFCIRPTERKKGYNKINLYFALEVCKEHNIDEVLMTCDKENPASGKTIEALGGKLEKEACLYGSEITQFYKLDVEASINANKSRYDKFKAGQSAIPTK